MTATIRRPLIGPTERELGRRSVLIALARNGIIGTLGDPHWPDALVTAWHRGEESDMGIRSAVRIAWQDAQPAPGATYQGVRLQRFGRAAQTPPRAFDVNWRALAVVMGVVGFCVLCWAGVVGLAYVAWGVVRG